jgi:dTDP-glucose 4,6-dehydratase/UDP-glucose 4-epimerase
MAELVVSAASDGRIVQKEWPQEWAHVETGDFFADIGKIKSATGWSPAVPLEEGIKATVDFYRKNLSYYL